MQIWNEELRVCPKCRAAVQFADEPRRHCPKCGSPVWFSAYRKLPPPPDLPEPKPERLWDHPTTTLLLSVTGILAFAVLVAVQQRLVVAAVSTLTALGFGVVAWLRHREARDVERRYEQAHGLLKYAKTMRDRLRDAVARHNNLLATGNARVEQYHAEILVRAERERTEAQNLRQQAADDRAAVQSVEDRIDAIAERLVDDHRKWSTTKLRPDPENYGRRKVELEKAFSFVRSVGYPLSDAVRTGALTKLRSDFERVVREHNAKEEQKRLNRHFREEERLQRERDQAVREAEEREREIQDLLEASLRLHRDAHGAEVDELRRQLAEAQANAERAKSMAQLTKAGHVYVLSNIGSFGERVYKVGMTRRLEPLDRVRELGDASVPFPFDVHAMISCENAPALENALHRELTRHRVNRINLRKEFFRVDLDTILNCVREHHGEIDYVANPEALQYRETMQMSPEEVTELERELAAAGVSVDDGEE